MYREYDPVRDERILDTVIVDCYGPDEELMGWYYYLADGLHFPFYARVLLPQSIGSEAEKKVQVMGVDPRSEQGEPLRLYALEDVSGQMMSISLCQIVQAHTAAEYLQILNDWLYWHNFEMLKEESHLR